MRPNWRTRSTFKCTATHEEYGKLETLARNGTPIPARLLIQGLSHSVDYQGVELEVDFALLDIDTDVPTGERRRDGELYISLLELEIKALRSVLSEYDGDKQEFLQMEKANAIAVLKHHLVRP